MKLRLKFYVAILTLVASIIPSFSASAIEATFEQSEITISREIIEVTDPVSNTFSYEITPATDNPGIVTGAPDSATIIFEDAIPTLDGRVLASSTIDFSGASFPAMGSYIFTIKEIESSDPILYPIINNIEFQIIVVVGYPTNADGVPDNSRVVANVLELAKKTVDGEEQEDKVVVLWTLDDHSEEPIETAMVGIHTETIGAISSVNPQCFAYALDISPNGFSSDDRLALMTRKSVGGELSACMPAGLSISALGDYEITPGERTIFKLAHNEVAYITLPVGTEYTFTRLDTTGIDYDDKYNTKIDQRFTNSITKITASIGDDEVIRLLNSRTPSSNTSFFQLINKENVVTGIIANSWPFLLLVLLVIGGIAIISSTNHHAKKKEKQKQEKASH